MGVFEAAENGGEDGLLIGGLVDKLDGATGHKGGTVSTALPVAPRVVRVQEYSGEDD